MAAKTTAPKTAIVTETEIPKVRPCACGGYEIEIWTGEVPADADPNDYVKYIGTGCIAETARTFAPGHDAKLKSLLIQAGADGNGVRTESGGVASISDAMHWAEFYGFGHMVRNGIIRETERRAARNAKKQVATAHQAAKAKTGRGKSAKALDAQKAELAGPAPEAVRPIADILADGNKASAKAVAVKIAAERAPIAVDIKIGRWTYAATVDAEGVATYTTKDGTAKVVAKGGYKIVAGEGAAEAGF